MKKLIVLLMLPIIFLTACSGADNISEDVDEGTEMTFTMDELSQYDGKDGNPAYIAIEGTVYDVSSNPLWEEGLHQNRFQAGADLTEEMKSAPHGLSKLTGLKSVGILAEE